MPTVLVLGLDKGDKLTEVRARIRALVAERLTIVPSEEVGVYLVADLLPEPGGKITIQVFVADKTERTPAILKAMSDEIKTAVTLLCPDRMVVVTTEPLEYGEEVYLSVFRPSQAA